MAITRKCKCGREFIVYPCELNRSKYCSKKCLYKYRVRPKGLKYLIKAKNKGWFRRKNGWTITQKGYKYIWLGKGERILEHRMVIENYIGRKLKEGEDVHHIDGNKLNNSFNNLEIIGHGKHATLHNLIRWEK